MNSPKDYVPPKVWKWEEPSGGAFANINKPTSGATYEENLPIGKHPLQLYSQGTPNGVKVTIMLEELLALGYAEAEYDAWLCKIAKGEQFSSGFVKANPNSKIPVLIDNSTKHPQRVFESGAIYYTFRTNLMSSCLKASVKKQNAFPGYSGKWEVLPI